MNSEQTEEAILNDIPRITSRKIDLNKKEIFLYNIIDEFKEIDYSITNKMFTYPQSFLKYSTTTYISPAYHLNQYLDNILEYNKIIINEKGKFQDVYNAKFNIDVNSIFILIKSLLDRLVTLLSFYYKKIQIKSTFGRIKDTGIASGLMNKVLELKGNDPIMEFVYNQYHDWIKWAVEPRNMIIHRHDLRSNFIYPVDGIEIPEHYIINIFEEITIESFDNKYNHIARFVEELYFMVDSIVRTLSKKEYNFSSIHFKDKEFFRGMKLKKKMRHYK